MAAPATNDTQSASYDVTAPFSHRVSSPPGRLDCARSDTLHPFPDKHNSSENGRNDDDDDEYDVKLLLLLEVVTSPTAPLARYFTTTCIKQCDNTGITCGHVGTFYLRSRDGSERWMSQSRRRRNDGLHDERQRQTSRPHPRYVRSTVATSGGDVGAGSGSFDVVSTTAAADDVMR